MALAALLAVSLSGASSHSAVAATTEPSTVADLRRAFAVGNEHADYVVVIDTSGSMDDPPENLYAKVRDAYAALVKALPAGERLSLITFDSYATVAYDGRLTDGDREKASRLPDHLGSNTDIGRALNAALDRLDRPDAAAVQTVLFLTDGSHDPRPDSEFRLVGNSAWQAIQARAHALERQRSIVVRALALSDAGRSGAELVDSVFGQVEIARLSGRQLATYLRSEVDKARLRLLARAISAELARGVTAQVSRIGHLGRSFTVKVHLASRMKHLGADVDVTDISATDGNGRKLRAFVKGDRMIHLPPGGSADVSVQLKPSVASTSFFDLPPPKNEELDVQLKLSSAITARPARLLRESVGVDPVLKVTDPARFSASRTVGRTWLRFLLDVASLIAVLAVGARLYWKYVMLPPLVGELTLVGGGDPIELSGKRKKIDSSFFGRPNGDTTVRLYTRRGRRNQVFAERIGARGSFERQLGVRWEPVKTGGTLGVTVYRIDGPSGIRFRYIRAREEQ